MGYSSAGEARQAREALGKALEALQQDSDIPDEVRGIAQNVAKSIGALFEAEYASTEPDGKTCIRNALGTLSQTLALLQDVKSEHEGVRVATERIADVISVLFPLTNKSSVRPEATPRGSVRPSHRPSETDGAGDSDRAGATESIQANDNGSVPPGPRNSARPSDRSRASDSVRVSASVRVGAPGSSGRPSSPPRASVRPSHRPLSERPRSGVPAPIPTSMLPPPAPVPTGPRRPIEANLGAATQSNFYVGFSGEIAHGGVFLATYETLPKDTSVSMLVTLPGGFEFECDGYVRFVRDPFDFSSESEPGMGIQFEDLSAEARELVLRFIRHRPPIFYDV